MGEGRGGGSDCFQDVEAPALDASRMSEIECAEGVCKRVTEM
jgi:hypothetical protein